MPIYTYQVAPETEGCDHCSHGFEVIQRMKEDALKECPKCGAPLQRLISLVGVATPKTNSELKNLGFKKLVKRDEGVYENVTRSDGEAKYMERGKSDTMPNLGKVISD